MMEAADATVMNCSVLDISKSLLLFVEDIWNCCGGCCLWLSLFFFNGCFSKQEDDKEDNDRYNNENEYYPWSSLPFFWVIKQSHMSLPVIVGFPGPFGPAVYHHRLTAN
jgi:hypothetical protein